MNNYTVGILHTVFLTFPILVLMRRIYLTLKTFFSYSDNVLLFLEPLRLINLSDVLTL